MLIDRLEIERQVMGRRKKMKARIEKTKQILLYSHRPTGWRGGYWDLRRWWWMTFRLEKLRQELWLVNKWDKVL